MTPSSLNTAEISGENFSRLNGVYKNQLDTLYGAIEFSPNGGLNEDHRALCDRLFLTPPDSGFKRNVLIKIDFVSKKKANIGIYNDKGVISSKSVKGKFKNGYFYIRPKGYIIPFFPLFYKHHFERVRITQAENALVVDHTMNSYVFGLVGGNSNKGRSTSIYEQKK